MSALARFPFSAVVGQGEARLALLLAAVDPGIGGVLLRGDKGAAKSTLARGLAGMLPGGAPFVELPLGATEDRVVGTIDAGVVHADGGAAPFRPGLLAAAHGGVLYVDEVNLLPDPVVDVLLDVAASGINRVERDGVSHSHPARFVLVGSMNPEEGELRPQLLDRFGLSVEIKAPADPRLRAEIVRRRLTHDAGGRVGGGEGDIVLRARLAASMPADLPDTVVDFACRLAVGVGAEGLRADLVLCRAAAAFAGWEGREVATSADVERVAAFALGHRRRRRPFDPPVLGENELERALSSARQSFADAYHQLAPPKDPAASPPGAGADATDAAEPAPDHLSPTEPPVAAGLATTDEEADAGSGPPQSPWADLSLDAPAPPAGSTWLAGDPAPGGTWPSSTPDADSGPAPGGTWPSSTPDADSSQAPGGTWPAGAWTGGGPGAGAGDLAPAGGADAADDSAFLAPPADERDDPAPVPRWSESALPADDDSEQGGTTWGTPAEPAGAGDEITAGSESAAPSAGAPDPGAAPTGEDAADAPSEAAGDVEDDGGDAHGGDAHGDSGPDRGVGHDSSSGTAGNSGTGDESDESGGESRDSADGDDDETAGGPGQATASAGDAGQGFFPPPAAADGPGGTWRSLSADSFGTGSASGGSFSAGPGLGEPAPGAAGTPGTPGTPGSSGNPPAPGAPSGPHAGSGRLGRTGTPPAERDAVLRELAMRPRTAGGIALADAVATTLPPRPRDLIAEAATATDAPDDPAPGGRTATRTVGRTVVLAVDASGSVGTHRRVEAATGAVLGLLADAYLRRDRVSLVTFRGDTAEVVLPPTASVELARTRLAELPTGGVTPLAEGISTGLSLARRADADGWPPLLVLVTDGRASGNQNAAEQAEAAAAEVAAEGVEVVVVDAEDGPHRRGLADRLATAMGGRCVRPAELTPAAVEVAVRDALR